MMKIRKITLGDLFFLKRKSIFRAKKDYSFMCHNNGIKAYILVGYKHFDDYHDDTIPGDVLDFWIKHSYEVIEVYSNERVNNDYPHLENTFDELVKHIHVGDILWTKPTSFVKEQHLKRLGFHYDQNYLIYTFQKS